MERIPPRGAFPTRDSGPGDEGEQVQQGPVRVEDHLLCETRRFPGKGRFVIEIYPGREALVDEDDLSTEKWMGVGTTRKPMEVRQGPPRRLRPAATIE